MAGPDLSEFIVLDTETTGIAVGSRLVEVAALHVKNGVVVRQFQSLVNPEMHIPSIVQGSRHLRRDGGERPEGHARAGGLREVRRGAHAHRPQRELRLPHPQGEYGRVKVATPGCGMYCSLKLARLVFPRR
ncbi:MAG: hypothetical protein IPN17_36035 [Deltaproteobacteria bacterium]|nr:hypothetical protein [Deltaproteobacteria bacterium]